MAAALPMLILAAALGTVWTASPSQAAAGHVQVPSVRAQAGTPTVTEQPTSLRLEPLGDSITYGTQSSTGNGYRGPLWNDLTGEGYRLSFVGSVQAGSMADSDNEGHPGLRIDQIAALTNTSLATYQPNVITLMAGTNDLVQDFQESTAPARLRALIDQITADDPTATVLVASLIVGANANIAAGEPAFNAAIPGIIQAEQAAGKHVALVDMGAVTTADLAADGIHPVDSGYLKMAAAWNEGIQTAAAAGWIAPPVALSGGPAAAGPTGEAVSGITGKCLDVNGASSADGTAVQLWTCNHTTGQTWTAYSDGSLRALGKCLDATAGGTANGTRAELWDCNGGANQVWQAYNGGYLNLVSGRCLDDPNASTTDGTQLGLWDCNGGANQLWGPPGLGPVTSGTPGKCLDDRGGSSADGTVVDLWDCNGTVAQQWSVANGTLLVNGKCLDITGGSAADGALVELWDCNGGANQAWDVENGTLVNPASGKCLDDPGFNTTDGTQLDLWDCNGGINQQWSPPIT
jgi:lysophospholipase L1-like esterase